MYNLQQKDWPNFTRTLHDVEDDLFLLQKTDRMEQKGYNQLPHDFTQHVL